MKRILLWWQNINWMTRLTSLIILLISLLMSGFVFFVLLNIQYQVIYADSSFYKDLSFILASNLVNLIEQNCLEQLISFLESIYLNTSIFAYLQLFNDNGEVVLSLPFYDLIFQNILHFKKEMLFFNGSFNLQSANHFSAFHENVIGLSIPLVGNSRYLGLLKLGFKLSSGIVFLSFLIQFLSALIFISTWLMFTLGAIFNSLIFIKPIRQLLIGINNIALGDFEQHIEISFGGQLADLIISFNKMSKRLQSYEKKNVNQLTSEKIKLETLVSTIADGAILLDTELRLLFVNQIAIKVFDWSNKDLIGTVISRHLPVHVNEALLPVLNNMVKVNYIEENLSQAQEISITLNYESMKTFRFLLATVVDQNQKGLMGLVITIQDITRETELNDAKNQFISNVSHELRTPLCNIGSFLETLIDYDYRLSDKQKSQFLMIAYTETQRLNRLVNDVLDLSRLEAKHNYILKPVQLMNIVLYTISLYQIVALNKKIKIIPEVSLLLQKIVAHESLLCQVLSNLISNSLKFTHVGGKIIIRVYPLSIYKKKRNVRVEVIDEGIGIDKIFCRQIFDRFMRIENHIHTLEGTGLGLSIVKSIVEKHCSTIFIYSEVGLGTSFWFDLLIDN